MRKGLLFFIILLQSPFVFTQTEIFIPYRKGDLWGFADTNMQTRINPQYTKVDMFHEGLAPVWNGKTCTYIHQNGIQVTNEKFDNCFEFRNGFARVDRGNVYAIINKNGKRITPFKYSVNYSRKPSPTDDMPFLMDSLTGLVLINGEELLIDTNGEELTGKEYRTIYHFQDHGLAGVLPQDRNKHENGLINRKGDLVVPFIYDDIDVFASGNLIYVQDDGKYGYVNPKGELVILLKYDGAGPFNYGKAIVKVKEQYGVIDTNDQLLLKPQNDYIEDTYDGYYILRNKKKYTILNPDLSVAFKHKTFHESWSLHRIESSGYYYVYGFNQIYFLDSTGSDIHREYRIPWEFEIDSAGYDRYGGGWYGKYIEFTYSPGYDDMFLSYENKKLAVVNGKGIMLTDHKYDQLDLYWSDMCRFRIGKKYGYLDRNGKEIASDFDVAFPFYHEFAMVMKDGLYGYINRQGEQIIPCIYQDGAYWFEDGMIKVTFNGKEGYLDKKGRQFFSE